MDEVIHHFKLTFVAERPPPPHLAYQERLMADETAYEYFSRFSLPSLNLPFSTMMEAKVESMMPTPTAQPKAKFLFANSIGSTCPFDDLLEMKKSLFPSGDMIGYPS